MGKFSIHEDEIASIELPGRKNKPIFGPTIFGKCKNMSMGIAEFPPGVLAPEHVHLEEEEIGYILSGEGEINIGGSIEKLSPGVCVYMPPQIPHQTRNTGTETLKVIYVFSPPLKLQSKMKDKE